jgi:lysophospholipase L1-like esterase
MKTLLGFGASTMQGVGDVEGGFLSRVGRQLSQSGAPVQVVNLGIGGDTTREMLRRANGVRSYAPFDLVVLLGCNDMPRAGDSNPANRTGLAEYRSNLQQLLAAIKGQHSLFVSSFMVHEKVGVSAQTFDAYMSAAMEIALALGYELWDLYGETKGKGSAYWAEDGVHFNPAGHQFIADGAAERYRRLTR